MTKKYAENYIIVILKRNKGEPMTATEIIYQLRDAGVRMDKGTITKVARVSKEIGSVWSRMELKWIFFLKNKDIDKNKLSISRKFKYAIQKTEEEEEERRQQQLRILEGPFVRKNKVAFHEADGVTRWY
ncbi:hypothetical protein LCGC14_0464510 [marine sediment metagenome]|uniref:Uncharacterized protein n=1 Tax=marine sediment metagenome TaxID=412755 RepID=A0A0F9SJ62_9ZZZZ